MKITAKLHASSSQERIKKINDKEYEIWLKEKPINNKANEKLIKILKKYFGTQGRTPNCGIKGQKYFKKQVKIIKGLKSKNKVVEVEE